MDSNSTINTFHNQIPIDSYSQTPQTLHMSSYTPSQNVLGMTGNFNQSSTLHSNGINDRENYSRPPRKLKVDDALSYLDQVRQQFADNPEVYNDFLEVMKEFKSHTIDTQGVIRRVSHLFSGYSNLITGFNTFLPPGYVVRVSGSTIRIIQPDGETTIVSEPVRMAEPSPRHQELPNVQHSLMQPTPTAIVAPTGVDAGHQRARETEMSTSHFLIAAPSAANSSAPMSQLAGAVDHHNNLRQAQGQQPSAMHAVPHQNFTPEIRHAFENASRSLTSPQQAAPIPIYDAHSTTSSELMTISGEGKEFSLSSSNAVGGQQPLHFDQAVGYLNKVKERFANRPCIYREFLSILGNYQKSEQVSMTETEVYQAVFQLFSDEEDLMRDFKSFLPDAGLESADKTSQLIISRGMKEEEEPSLMEAADSSNAISGGNEKSETVPSSSKESVKQAKKRNVENTVSVGKKSKVVTNVGYNMSVEKCLEDIPLKDFVFFERVHKALKSEQVVKNFFRCLLLYNKSLVSKHELIELSTPFLVEHPDLLRQFNEILGIGPSSSSPNKLEKVEHRLLPDLALQIDYSTCKRLGVSYRSLPESYERSVCSGRTKLCNSVLNDTWVSFPSWSSESTESVSSKKSVFEDFMYRTEDERFEVDILIEVNSAAISALESVRRKIDQMKLEEAQKFKLDANYGCNSPTLMGRAVKKLYGEHATKVLEGLRDNPVVAVPQVLKRLREKDTEWRSVREEFNAIWRDQIDKNYLKSLDHQAISFKANDLKFLRSKTIIQQLETFYDERQARIENGESVENGPHMILEYPEDVSVIHDANELLIHHVKRQPNIPKKEKFMIKKLLRIGLIPRLFNLDVESMSDDEEENDLSEKTHEGQITTRRTRRLLEAKLTNAKKNQLGLTDVKIENTPGYTLFFGTNCWLIFVRLHHIICERLARLKSRTAELVAEYEFETQIRERQEKIFQRHGRGLMAHQHNAVDVQLGLRELKKPLQNPEHFYTTLLHELKNVLDGIIDSSTFEDTLSNKPVTFRNMFGTSAYIMFTMDKLIATITRQMQHFVTDDTSVSAVNLFQKYCLHRSRNNSQPLFALDEQYECAAEKVIINQNCYKMFFMHLLKPTLSVELINTDADEEDEDESGDDSFVNLSKWSEFVEKYAMADESDSNTSQIQREPFLLRNLMLRKIAAEASFDPFSAPIPTITSPFYANEGLRAVLSAKNLRLLYERGTSDVLIKKGAPSSSKKTHRELFERRRSRFNSWLAKNGQKQTLAANAKTSSVEAEDIEASPFSADQQPQPAATADEFKWFAENCRCCLYRHRDFEYITYTRYFTLPRPSQEPPSSSSQATAATSTSSTTIASSLSLSPAHYIGHQ